MSILKRGSIYQLRKRVPRSYHAVETRDTVWISLHTDSETVAKTKASVAWTQMIEAWEARLAGDTDDAEACFDAAKELAAVRGFRYLPSAQLAMLPREELLRRIEAVPLQDGRPDKVEAAALLGGAADPPITVSRALELFWSLAKDRTLDKSTLQIQKWENPRRKAVRNFIAVAGDKILKDISGDDMLVFRDWWMDRLESEGLNPSSANKDLIHLEVVRFI